MAQVRPISASHSIHHRELDAITNNMRLSFQSKPKPNIEKQLIFKGERFTLYVVSRFLDKKISRKKTKKKQNKHVASRKND